MSSGFVIEPEKKVVLDNRRSTPIPLKDVPFGRVFIRDGWSFQASRTDCEFTTLKVGDRFRYQSDWYERAPGKNRAYRLIENSYFGAPRAGTTVEFFETTKVQKLVVEDRGAP